MGKRLGKDKKSVECFQSDAEGNKMGARERKEGAKNDEILKSAEEEQKEKRQKGRIEEKEVRRESWRNWKKSS